MTLRRLQNLFDFRVVNPLDFRLILKRALLTDMSIDLEPRLVQAVLVLFSTNVVHDHRSRLGRSLVCLRSADVARCWETAIAGVFVVVEIRDYVVGLRSFRGRLARLDFVVIVAQKMGCSG